MNASLDLNSTADYRMFLKIKSLPKFSFQGREAWFPDEYASMLGMESKEPEIIRYQPLKGLFDYQRDISAMALRKRKFCVFAEPGLGKTLILLEYAKHVRDMLPGKRILIVSPLMVVKQTINEATKFYGGKLAIEQVPVSRLNTWLSETGKAIGITNYEAMRPEVNQGYLGCLMCDECFPGDTLIGAINPVDKSLCNKYIKDVVRGDVILNASGVDVVHATWKRRIYRAVCVTAGANGFTCSENHLCFTLHGWKCAKDLRPGDFLVGTKEAMRLVRNGVQTDQPRPEESTFLRNILLGEMANAYSGEQVEGLYTCGISEDTSCKREMEEVAHSGPERGNSAAFERSKQIVRAGSEKENIRESSGDWSQAKVAWRQRYGNDGAAEITSGVVAGWMDSGMRGSCRKEFSQIPHVIQAEYWESFAENRHRGGWTQASQSALSGKGREEGRMPSFVRVDSVKVLELGHPDLDRYRDEKGHIYFYDIEATRHPSFSVNGLLVHNSSMLKSHYGKWGMEILRLGKGLDWKLCLTGTPAPNDRIEYANHAVLMDAFPTVNSFLARFFVNRGQTCERWELKAHALDAFYRALSHWCIFVTNPVTYGWKDNVGVIPPIRVHIHNVDLTDEQQAAVYAETKTLFVDNIGGITTRSKLGQIGKGHYNGTKIDTLKPAFIRALVDSWPEESTLIWCIYNREQEDLEKMFPEAISMKGDTPYEQRDGMIEDFKSGRKRILISKPKVLGFGLNLQIATRQIFSGLQDSWESFYQAIKRSNRVGSTRPLNVHIPITEVERPMVDNVLRKAHRIEWDTKEQERIFKSKLDNS